MTISSGRILSSSWSQASVVAVPEQKVYGRVEGIRLHDRFRIALEESVALVSGGIAMCGRALQDKEKWSQSPMLHRLCCFGRKCRSTSSSMSFKKGSLLASKKEG